MNIQPYNFDSPRTVIIYEDIDPNISTFEKTLNKIIDFFLPPPPDSRTWITPHTVYVMKMNQNRNIVKVALYVAALFALAYVVAGTRGLIFAGVCIGIAFYKIYKFSKTLEGPL